jgi:hypothetical protein
VRVLVLVVLVMRMPALVLHRLVKMFVLVPLGQMWPQPQAHQGTCNDELDRERFAQHEDREHRSHERRKRKMPRQKNLWVT